PVVSLDHGDRKEAPGQISPYLAGETSAFLLSGDKAGAEQDRTCVAAGDQQQKDLGLACSHKEVVAALRQQEKHDSSCAWKKLLNTTTTTSGQVGHRHELDSL
ncbi:unnamed protein product, partial [Amoebophrya sp. A25]